LCKKVDAENDLKNEHKTEILNKSKLDEIRKKLKEKSKRT